RILVRPSGLSVIAGLYPIWSRETFNCASRVRSFMLLVYTQPARYGTYNRNRCYGYYKTYCRIRDSLSCRYHTLGRSGANHILITTINNKGNRRIPRHYKYQFNDIENDNPNKWPDSSNLGR